MTIRKITQYLGENGERIEELRSVDCETLQFITEESQAKTAVDGKNVLYLGLIIIPVSINDVNGQMIDIRPQELRFPIDANSLKEAFEKFANCMEDSVKDLQKRNEERNKEQSSQIIIAGADDLNYIDRSRR